MRPRIGPGRVAAVLAWLAFLHAGPTLEAATTPRSPAGQESSPAGLTTPADPELERQVREVAKDLRCPVCRALSVYDSPSEMAGEMEDLIREKLRSGMTPDEVRAYFVERYGEWILLEPRATGFNWSVWLAPLALLVGGLAFVWITARRWVARGRARAAALGETREEAV